MDNKSVQRRNSRRIKLLLRFVTIVMLSTIASVSVLGFMSYNQYQEMKDKVEFDRIYKNVFINDIDVGGLSKDEAFDKLYEEYQLELDKREIILFLDEKQLSLKYEDFDAKYDFSDAIDEAYQYAKNGNLRQRYELITKLDSEAHVIDFPKNFTYKNEIIPQMITDFGEEIKIEPKNATVTRENGEMRFTSGKLGWEIDIAATTEMINSYMAIGKTGMLEVVMQRIEPRYTEDDLRKAQTLLGSFSTNFSPGENGRNENIKNALSKINNTVLYPEEVFSTIKSFGAMTYDNGYRLAPEIVNGKLVDGYGGGVCQVSSTMYNAVLYAELEVVERRNHSLKVGYLDYGFDAMIAGDYYDFRFKNNTEYPVIIEGYIVGGNTAVVNIYGYESRDPNRRLKFFNEFVSKIEPGADIIKEDPTMPEGERVVVAAAKAGYKYNLYKSVYDGDTLISTEFVSASTYKATPAEVVVGIGAPQDVPEENLLKPVTDISPFIYTIGE